MRQMEGGFEWAKLVVARLADEEDAEGEGVQLCFQIRVRTVLC